MKSGENNLISGSLLPSPMTYGRTNRKWRWKKTKNFTVPSPTTSPFTTFALVFIYSDEGPILSQRLNPRKTMYLLYQALGGKAEKGKTATISTPKPQ